jgi:hypothetical protein
LQEENEDLKYRLVEVEQYLKASKNVDIKKELLRHIRKSNIFQQESFL